MRYAQEMYRYCTQFGFGRGFTEKLALKHFKIIEDNLQSDEDAYVVFIGLHNYKSLTNHDNNFAYAVTNKRIIMAQHRILGEVCQSVSLDYVNDITLSTGLARGLVTIDTMKERFNVMVDKNAAQNICNAVHSYLDERRSQKEAAKAPAAAPAQDFSALKQLKELLDQGIISQSEFDQKKRQILGL